jgi:hypothetical protein
MLKNEAYAGKVGIALPPANKTPATFSGCNMLFVGGDCKQPDEASIHCIRPDQRGSADPGKELGIPRYPPVPGRRLYRPGSDERRAAECVAKGVGMPRATWSTTFQKIRNDLFQQVLYGKMNAAMPCPGPGGPGSGNCSP